MMQPRNFEDVLTAVILATPTNEPEMLRRLRLVLHDAGFTAPEARWQNLGWRVEAIIEDGMLGSTNADRARGWRALVLGAWLRTEARG